MSALTRDPLLTIAKAVIVVVMAILGLAIAACVVAIPGMLLGRMFFPAAFAEGFPGADPISTGIALIVVLSLTIAVLTLVILALRLLKQIVDTVGVGDPFVPDNARRLTTMAWLALATQVLSIPLAAIGVWLAHFSAGDRLHVDEGVSGNGLLLVLVLFVLARVFRQGTAMREELEGTV